VLKLEIASASLLHLFYHLSAAPALWNYYQFRGKDWQKIRDVESLLYLKNTYRVLLTRARQGLIIFIPKREENDPTRIPLFLR
jgi:hypothetical protein